MEKKTELIITAVCAVGGSALGNELAETVLPADANFLYKFAVKFASMAIGATAGNYASEYVVQAIDISKMIAKKLVMNPNFNGMEDK